MRQVRLIHWNAAEAEVRAAKLRAAGYGVVLGVVEPASLRELREHPPCAVVIDLTRLPSHGRDVALAIRYTKGTRHLPLVFVEGDPEKVSGIREKIPDGVYTTWSRIRSDLKRAIAHPPEVTVAPRSVLEGYSQTPLPKKLGIRENSVVALVGAPPGFRKALGPLPAGVTFQAKAGGKADLNLWFIRSRSELERGVGRMAAAVGEGGLWIAWPKKSSPLAADVSEREVRGAGLATGLVDFKICAIDADWSGLRFSRRKAK